MNSSTVLNVCLILGVLGLALDASANLIRCNKAKVDWAEPVSECDQDTQVIHDSFIFSSKPKSDFSWNNNDGFFLTTDDLRSAQFIMGVVTNSQLAGLCRSNDQCNKNSTSLFRQYTRGVIVRVSEPAPMLLVILGVLGLGLVRRRLR